MEYRVWSIQYAYLILNTRYSRAAPRCRPPATLLVFLPMARTTHLALAGLIVFAAAGVGVVLHAQYAMEQDLLYLHSALETAEVEQHELSGRRVRQTAQELFPPVDSQELQNVRGAAPQGEESTLVIRVNGVPTALNDVPIDSWFAPYIRDIAQRGIVSGYQDAQGLPTGFFGPQDSITIEQLAKVVIEAIDVDKEKCEEEAKNVSAAGRWSQSYITCAEMLGWAVFSDGSINVESPANRAQVVATVLQGFGADIETPTGDRFEDVSLSTEFAAAIETAALNGMVGGYTDAEGNATGTFGPLDPVNRAQMAKILSLALQVY